MCTIFIVRSSYPLAVSCGVFFFDAVCDYYVCVRNIWRTAERICAKFTWKTCLVLCSSKVKVTKDKKTAFSALSAACVRLIFGPCLLWQNGRMDQDGTWHGGGPWSRPHCIRRGPSFRERGIAAPPPLFGPCLLWPRSPISATTDLVFKMASRSVQPLLQAHGYGRRTDRPRVCGNRPHLASAAKRPNNSDETLTVLCLGMTTGR